MESIKDISDRLGKAFQKRVRNQSNASMFVKIVFAVFSAVSAIVQFIGNSPLTTANYVGIGSAIFAAIGAFFLAISEKDSSEELEIARQAVVNAREKEIEFQELMLEYTEYQELEIEQVRAQELYQALTLMRGVIERIIGGEKKSLQNVVKLLLEASQRSLIIAAGYQLVEHYTLCVYMAERDAKTHEVELRCIAQTRTIECALSDARKWKSGVGVAGAALARGTEVVVPDMTALQIGTLYSDLSKPDDADRYKSIAAVPVLAGGHNDAWGVVVGTSDRPNHFIVDHDRQGVQTVEAIRALAGMVALAVRADQSRGSCVTALLPRA